MEKVIQYDGATITVRRGNVRSRLQQGRVYNRMELTEDIEEDAFLEINLFARLLTQVSIDGKCDLAWPTIGSDKETLQQAMETFMTSDKPIYNEIVDALYEIDSDDYNDPELRAEADPKD